MTAEPARPAPSATASATASATPSAPASLHKDSRDKDIPVTPPFRRVLIANRGEIAVRIIRACHEMGIEAVAVYSEADVSAAHVRMADAAVRLGPAPSAESYLRIDAVVQAALDTGAEAVHPGYGFLAERAAFARAVEAAGLAFVGPPSESIDALGDKLHARRTAQAVGVDAVPGTLEPAPIDRPDQVEGIIREAERVGFPLLVKAAAGGGGRGMRRVTKAADLPAALVSGSREAASAFGDGSVYLEREIAPARHIEVQLLGDSTGQVVALGERDCSLQRRHQKLIEEAPAPGLTTDERRHLHELAVRVASAAGLRNAATAEFLRAPDGAFYFLEVNTRLQVEHGVTELVAGLDIVQEQLHLAAGRPLSARALAAAARAAEPASHAIEVRISAEDPGRDFAPTPGRVGRWVMAAGPGVRVDTAIEPGDRVPPDYDNLIAKLMVHAADRGGALDRLIRALDETEISGIQTTLPFHRFVAASPAFRSGELSTGWVGEHWDGPATKAAAARLAQVAAALHHLGRGTTSPPGGGGVAAGAHPAGRSGQADGHVNGRWHRSGVEAAVDRWPR
jgi:acetyl/propionyl-CoA carboxylase alpha subunit